jgi:hypothetical protein
MTYSPSLGEFTVKSESCFVLIPTFTIHSTKKIKYLEENVASIDIQLAQQENDEIRKVVEAVVITGDRYPPGFGDSLYAETPEL